MKGIDAKQFNKIVRKYSCDEDVNAQIREFIITTMIPDEDVIRNHCIVELPDKSRRLFNRPKQTRFFDVVFYVMYYQIGHEFVGEPVLEITYDAAWELPREDYEQRMTEQKKAVMLLREAEVIINPSYIE